MRKSQVFRMCFVLICVIGFLSSSVNSHAQTPKFESASECADWFLVSWKAVNDKFACAGRSTMSGTQSPGYVNVDWFEVRFVDPQSREVFHYSENQFSYSDGEMHGLWEKWCKRGTQKFLYAMSSYEKRMDEVPIAVFNNEGELIDGVAPSRIPPNPFGFAIRSPSAFNTDFDSIDRTFSTWNRAKMEDLSDVEQRKVVFMHEDAWGMEVHFNPAVGGMPEFVRGFFRDKTRKGAVDKSFFSKINFETKTKWKCLDDQREIYAPESVDSFVHRINATSKHSKQLKIQATWSIERIGKHLFSDDSLDKCLDDRGPLAELRKDLYEKLNKQVDASAGVGIKSP